MRGVMLSKAIQIATNAHNGQFDRGGNPYILHPLKVMHYLKSTDEELQCIALLHDVIEDTSVTYCDLLSEGMSIRVIEAVRALTKQPGFNYADYKQQVFANKDAMLVKMADLRHNTDIRRLKGVSDKDIARMAKYHEFYMELQIKLNETTN